MLSDTTIRQYLTRGELVPGGDPDKALHSTYQFTAGKIFSGGDKCQVVDWSAAQPTGHYTIAPGAMIWVRMREAVELPNNICAVWWQTHFLSKKGIMLINMSIVDPGYKGYLTGLLVNFGNQPVVITPDLTVAKLAFFRTDKVVGTPYASNTPLNQYDADVHQTAITGPTSFLQLDNLSTELGAKKEAILKEIADDAPKKLGKAYVWAGLGFILLLAANTFVPWAQSQFKPSLDEAVEDAIDKRVASQLSMLPSEREKALSIRVEKLEKALAAQSAGAKDKDGAVAP